MRNPRSNPGAFVWGYPGAFVWGTPALSSDPSLLILFLCSS